MTKRTQLKMSIETDPQQQVVAPPLMLVIWSSLRHAARSIYFARCHPGNLWYSKLIFVTKPSLIISHANTNCELQGFCCQPRRIRSRKKRVSGDTWKAQPVRCDSKRLHVRRCWLGNYARWRRQTLGKDQPRTTTMRLYGNCAVGQMGIANRISRGSHFGYRGRVQSCMRESCRQSPTAYRDRSIL